MTNHLDLGDDLATALARPRFHHQWRPDELRVEKTMDTKVIEALRARGHDVREVESAGATNAVGRPDADGPFIGASDPRMSGKAAGW